MGTLETSSLNAKETKSKETKAYSKNEKKLEKEFHRIRVEIEEIRQAFRYLEDAGSQDDICSRLNQLEKATRRVRKGGLFSHGAKQHRKLLHKLNDSPIE